MAKIIDPILEFELIGKDLKPLIERAHRVHKSLNSPATERLYGHLQVAMAKVLNSLQSAEAAVVREMSPTPTLELEDDE